MKYHNNCRFCKQTWFKYKAENKDDLKYLEKREEEYFRTVCPHCDKQFCEAYFAKRHIQSEHNTSLFKCGIWEREFQSKIAMTYHENLMHTTDNTRVPCYMCNKTFGPSVLHAPAEQLRWPLFLVINLFLLSCCCYLVHAPVVKIP